MSRERTPVLCGAIPTLEMLMTSWERMHIDHPRAAAIKHHTDIALYWATKYYNKMDETDAYVISMCTLPLLSLTSCSNIVPHSVLNPSQRLRWIRRHWDANFIATAEQTVKDVVCESDFDRWCTC